MILALVPLPCWWICYEDENMGSKGDNNTRKFQSFIPLLSFAPFLSVSPLLLLLLKRLPNVPTSLLGHIHFMLNWWIKLSLAQNQLQLAFLHWREREREREGERERERECIETLIRLSPVICHFKQRSKAACGDSLSAIKQRRSTQPEIDD